MKKAINHSFLVCVQEALGQKLPQKRRLADRVLNFPERLSGYSARAITQLADVSNATVSRIFRKIGYQSFEDARQAVRFEQESGPCSLRLENGSGTELKPLVNFLEQSQKNLRWALGENVGFSDPLASLLRGDLK